MKNMLDNFNPNDDLRFIKKVTSNPKFRKHITTRCACLGVFVLLWVWFNGGLMPFFLRQKIPMLKIGSEVNILYYFSEVDDDGANIRWAHGVNNMEQLEKALDSHDIHMIEADVMLRGQGTANQALIPVMAELPSTDSDLTFDDWLDLVIKSGQKGIKLDFQAIDAVDITLQKMKEKKSQILFPVWLHADVLKGPYGAEPRVDATRFIRIVKRLFPECTLSLGWTTGSHTDLSQSGYSWNMVLDMYHLVDKLELEPPLVYSVRSIFIPNSVPQLKWLTDNTRASVLVWRKPVDRDTHEDLMYMCYRFPPHNLLFDLQDEKLDNYVKENHLKSRQSVDPQVLMRDTIMFKPDAWVKMGFYMDQHSLLPSTEAILLNSRAVYLVTKARYKPSELIKLKGRVQFHDRRNLKAEDGVTGISIFLRSTSYIDYERIAGIKCFIGLDGELTVSSSNMPGKEFKESQRITPGSINCYRFSVVDTGRQILFQVNVQHDCHTLSSTKPDEQTHAMMKVKLPDNIGGLEYEHPFIIKLDDSKRTAIIDELTIKYH